MRILDDNAVLDFLDGDNHEQPKFTTQQIQIHIDFKCGCKITQDKHNSLHPCSIHNSWALENRNGKVLHKNLQ